MFQIGFNKCGTTSLHEFFEKAGLRSIHWGEGYLAPRMEENIKAGRRAISGYEEYDAFTNMDYFCEHREVEIGRQQFQVLAKQEPDARFILNIRDVGAWIRSRTRMGQNRKPIATELAPSGKEEPCPRRLAACCVSIPSIEMVRRYHGFESHAQVVDLWRRRWFEHIAAVQKAIPASRLLVFDIKEDDPVSLCRFLNLPDDMAREYGHANPTTPGWVQATARWVPAPMKQLIPKELKDRGKVLLGR